MKLETKYDIGQDVWFIKDNHLYRYPIHSLKAYSIDYVGEGKYIDKIIYCISSFGEYNEKDLYLTKEDLIEAIS